jgi:arginine:pyruvate transaminase
MQRIAALCREHDLWLLSDEVYEDLAVVRPHIGAWSLPSVAERAVVVSSLSKSHALPGFRLGWIVGPPELIRHLANLLLCLTYGSPPFIQDGALAALSDDLTEVAALREDYRWRAAWISELLGATPGCRAIPPEGGMFVLLDVRGTGLAAADFARRLLDSERVAVLPCDGFGPSTEGHLRIALSAPEPRLRDAANRILRFVRGLNRPLIAARPLSTWAAQ